MCKYINIKYKGRTVMIFYFSGTGNSKFTAEYLAEMLGDKACSITDSNMNVSVKGEETAGFVFPIYAWGTAEPMLNFIKNMGNTGVYTYAVATCGADAGLALKKLDKICKINSAYSISMPNNYIVGSDTDSPAEIEEKLAKAKEKLKDIAEDIKNRKNVYDVNEGKAAFLKSSLICYGFNKFARSTKQFFADEKCTGCGQCAKECPAETISIKDGRPVWGEKCYQCLACINRCPQNAIQYGKDTENRKRYKIEDYN